MIFESAEYSSKVQPQHLHGHPGMDVEGDQERGAGAPGGVH
jgi:hypothetical protein